MSSQLFYVYGEICSTHPWEVIVATVTLTISILTVDQHHTSPVVKQSTRSCCQHDYNAVDMIVMTIIRCLAVLYSYYQFCNLQKLGSKYILGIAGLFTVFSSFVFTSAVLNFLHIDLTDLKDALFFFLLLIDLSKATMLARFALSASSENEIKYNIARGMSVLGPAITLDTIVETLVIGILTLSGVHRLEMLSYFACLSVIVNYVVFMTFYPACLSLILELSKKTSSCETKNVNTLLLTQAFGDVDPKANPVVQRVKIIMSVGLTLVHVISRWPLDNKDENTIISLLDDQRMLPSSDSIAYSYSPKWLSLCADHIVVLILLFALIIKFIFFENQNEFLASASAIHVNQSPSVFQRQAESKINSPEIKASKQVQADVPIAVPVPIPIPIPVVEVTPANVEDDDDFEVNFEECVSFYKTNLNVNALRDREIIELVKSKHIPIHQIEKAVTNLERAVKIRRQVMSDHGNFGNALKDLPYESYDYNRVLGACCENVIGYVPIPLGLAGPLKLDGKLFYVPMATTEGCLVASTTRGSRAVSRNGISSRVVSDGMARGPVVRFQSLTRASEALLWMEQPENFKLLKDNFDSTSLYARLTRVHIRIAGRYLFIRFVAKTGDAMGMNMLSKGTEKSLNFVQTYFPDMEILSLSGNFCTDKKPAAVNWLEGRGKSVACEAIVPADVVSTVLKTTVHALIDVNISKNLVGSAIAGTIGGCNAHAANIVTAIYIATGQDPAQNVVSSNCMTLMEPWGENGQDLYISCTMPSIEIGTVGGGTVLSPQSACLEILGVRGSNIEHPGDNANQLARIVCGTVLAGELSLMAALSAGHLVKSHLRHNRSTGKF